MRDTIVEQLGRFALDSDFEDLPADVVDESKRVLLDSLGCALGGLDDPKGRIGVEYGRVLGAGGNAATVIGSGDRLSIFGAAFANAELVNALDFDAILPPGHVIPYVLPGALAVAESGGATGKDLISAIAVAQEMSYRLGKAMDYLRDIKDGQAVPPAVYGYSSTVFGATAAIIKLRGLSPEVMVNGLGIAGSTSPVQSHGAWFRHAPGSTIKYLLAGGLSLTALTAAHMAEFGHRGDLQTLDDHDYGFPRFIGTTRWEPDRITAGLGEEWLFPAEASYKPYPHCRVMHALLDALTEVVETHDIRPAEIEGMKAWVEAFTFQPIWLNRSIEHVQDAQFSMAHGLAVGAHRVTPSKAWQDPELVFNRSVLDLMEKVEFEPHPGYAEALAVHPSSRPTKIEVRARGEVFVAERNFPKGSPSPEPDSTMSTDELVTKFRVNAEGVLPASNIQGVIDGVLNLETVPDVRTLMRELAK